MEIKTASIYWIHLPEHTDPFTEGYIGVSKEVELRINQHLTEILKNSHSNMHLVNAVNKYGWNNLIKEVLLTDNEETCYIKENELRPQKSIGWNIAPGGHRGPGRLKGQRLSEESIKKGKETKRLRDERILSGNTTDADLAFLERKKERSLLAQKKLLEKQQTKIKEKELKKQQMLNKKEAIRLEKSRNRTKGMIILEQPTRPLCEHCQVSLAKANGVSKHGFKQWHKYCVQCAKILYNPKFEYLKNKKATCESCGFIPEDNCQIDIVKDNNDYKTLCANCHRLYKKRLRENKKSILDITVDADVIL